MRNCVSHLKDPVIQGEPCELRIAERPDQVLRSSHNMEASACPHQEDTCRPTPLLLTRARASVTAQHPSAQHETRHPAIPQFTACCN